MSMLLGILLRGQEDLGDVVTVSGGSYSASNAAADAVIDLKFDTDGKVYTRQNSGSFVQRSTLTDWIRPTSSSPGLYEIRYTSATGDTGAITATSVEDTWYTLTTGNWFITVTDTSTSPATTQAATFTVEIRENGGAVLDSASYTLTADRDDS